MKPSSVIYFDENRFDAAMGRRGLPRPRKEPPGGWSTEAPDPMRMLRGHPHLKIRKEDPGREARIPLLSSPRGSRAGNH